MPIKTHLFEPFAFEDCPSKTHFPVLGIAIVDIAQL